jgi:hypothetical protein
MKIFHSNLARIQFVTNSNLLRGMTLLIVTG